MNSKILAVLVTLLLSTHVVWGSTTEKSHATSVATMVELLQTERLLIDNLENYGNLLEKKLQIVRSGLTSMRTENEKSHVNPEEYLANPLNAFSLIRRMHSDWIYWELFIGQTLGKEQAEIIQLYRANMTTDVDLTEGVNAIHRLQTTYNLKPEDMATGVLNGKQYEAKFEAIDCYSIGLELTKQQMPYPAAFWLYTALQIYKQSDSDKVLEFSKRKIYELYADVLQKENRYKDALTVIELILAEDPHDAAMLHKKSQYTLKLHMGLEPQKHTPLIETTYHKGCRGHYPRKLSNLYCRYNTTTTDFLKLAPLKMEEIYLDPYMVVYHDVISDTEIAHLQELARPSLHRATVLNVNEKRNEVVSTRTSKFSWFQDDTTPTTSRLNRRINDMTGFDLYGSEMLQVMNYGLGGHYDTHFDYFSENATVNMLYGNRKATVLFYLNDVEQGGATVFPNLQVAVLPQKGTAIIWYNLNNRGDGDPKTLHAACPVLVGSKWVCNKWIREKNQMFHLPCYSE